MRPLSQDTVHSQLSFLDELYQPFHHQQQREKASALRLAVLPLLGLLSLSSLGLLVWSVSQSGDELATPAQTVEAVSPPASISSVLPAPPVAVQPPTPAPAVVATKPAPLKAIAVTPEMLAKLTSSTAAPAAEDPPANVSRSITLSHPESEQAAVGGLLDMAQAAALDATVMDGVDRAIIQAFRTHWTPPASELLDPDHSTVILDIDVSREGRVTSFKLTQPSGHTALDASVMSAANQLNNIGTALPNTFPRSRYEPRLHFHAE